MSSTKTRFEIVQLSEVPTNRSLGSPTSCEEKSPPSKAIRVLGDRRDLHRRIGTSPKEEYKRLTEISNEARVKSEEAKLALEQHIAAHGC
jgi:hypothetical protein